jgi:hypothetical protein
MSPENSRERYYLSNNIQKSKHADFPFRAVHLNICSETISAKTFTIINIVLSLFPMQKPRNTWRIDEFNPF